MRILCGSPIRQDPSVLKAHLSTLEWQQSRADVDFLFVDDCVEPDSSALLRDYSTLQAPPSAPNDYAKEESTTLWTEPAFERMAAMRQSVLDHARENRYDAVWLVDSDLLLDPGTLRSLIATEKPIVSAVFWTRWQPQAPPLPQVWLTHPYGLSGRGKAEHEFLRELSDRQLVRVYGLGGCTLIRSEAFDKVAYAPLLEGLPEGGMWRGEDRSFCIRAERAHVPMFADAWPSIFHCYRPSDRVAIPRILAHLREPRKERVEDGDWFSATIQPMQEPHLAQWKYHLRARLGRERLLPSLEEKLRELPVGESATTELVFPHFWPIEGYRGKKKLVRLSLLDVMAAQ